MKKLIILLGFCSICTFGARASGSISHTVSLDYSDMTVDSVCHSSGEVFSTLNVPACNNIIVENEPTLPVTKVTFEVPLNTNNFNVTLDSYVSAHKVSVTKPILPGEILTTNEYFEGVSNAVVYGNGYNNMSAVPTVTVTDNYLVDGYRHMVCVTITPVAYIHSKLSVICFTDISFTLTYDNCAQSDLPFNPIVPKNLSASTKATLQARQNICRVASESDTQMTDSIQNYLILSPRDLASGFDRLAEWKRQKGYNVKIQAFEDIYENPRYAVETNDSCFDRASSCREWMQDYYAENGAYFCLIAGDYRTSAPIRKACSNLTYNYKDHEYLIPTDAYFADLVSKYDMQLINVGIYSYGYNFNSFCPTVPVGRLLCSSLEEIKNFTEKVITYELYPGKGNPEYLGRGLLTQHQDAFISTGFNENIFDYLSMFNLTSFRSNEALTRDDLFPKGNDVVDEMRNSGLISLQGHGNPYSFETARCKYHIDPKSKEYVFDGESVYSYILPINSVEYRNASWYTRTFPDGFLSDLNNENFPSIVYSIGCTLVPFDEYDAGKDCEYNMGAAFTVAGKYGGPVFISNTRDGQWGHSNFLEANFGQTILSNHSPVGIAENDSRVKTECTHTFYKRVCTVNNVIGDPEIKIWTTVPAELEYRYNLKQNKLNLKGFNFENVILGFSDDNFTEREYIKSSNSLEINLNPKQEYYTLKTVTIETPNHYPATLIFTNGLIQNIKREIVVRNLKLRKELMANGDLNSDFGTKMLIGNGTKIKIKCLNDIDSQGGIDIRVGGELTMESEKTISLTDDIVQCGGNLEVKSESLELGKGFMVVKGGSFTYTNMRK